MSRILGIDPGIDGAIALRLGDGTISHIMDIPTTIHGTAREVDGRLVWEHLAWLQAMQPVEWCFVEETHAMPKIGSQANHSQGFSKGAIITALRIVGIPTERVAPSIWKRWSGLTGKPKAASLDLARELFPDRINELRAAKHHNRAEAMLIARYGAMLRVRESRQEAFT